MNMDISECLIYWSFPAVISSLQEDQLKPGIQFSMAKEGAGDAGIAAIVVPAAPCSWVPAFSQETK